MHRNTEGPGIQLVNIGFRITAGDRTASTNMKRSVAGSGGTATEATVSLITTRSGQPTTTLPVPTSVLGLTQPTLVELLLRKVFLF